MTLSISKLEKILTNKGLLPKKFFVMNDLLIYLEVFCIFNADSFILYIPSKYEIAIGSGENIYKIRFIDISEDGYIPSDYAGEPDNFDIEQQYDKIDIDNDINNNNDMAKYLEENYNNPISLKDINKSDKLQLREIFRQLRRLKFCVQGLKYKISIMFKDYLCCIRRDDTFEGFIAPNFKGSLEMKLMISLDLETLYEKLDSLSLDIKTVRKGIYRVLDKNQTKNLHNLQKILEQKNDLAIFSDIVLKKKKKYSEYLDRMEQLLSDLGKSEKRIVEKIINIQERYSNDTSIKGLHSDIEKSHQVSKLESELSKINLVKQELVENILNIKTKHEDLSLKVDKIFFENIVMIDAIIKNFFELKLL